MGLSPLHYGLGIGPWGLSLTNLSLGPCPLMYDDGVRLRVVEDDDVALAMMAVNGTPDAAPKLLAALKRLRRTLTATPHDPIGTLGRAQAQVLSWPFFDVGGMAGECLRDLGDVIRAGSTPARRTALKARWQARRPADQSHLIAYNPNWPDEPRDDAGEWTEGGGAGKSTGPSLDDVVAEIERTAQPFSIGQCGEYVGNALRQGGFRIPKVEHAGDMGGALTQAGFAKLPVGTTTFRKGDVVVFPRNYMPGRTDGHAAIFNGSVWIAEFRHTSGIYPKNNARIAQAPYTVYRYGR